MAAINPTYTYGDDTILATWANVTQADTFVSVGGPRWENYRDRQVMITGTIGGATVVINGSEDDSTYVALTDPQGNAISKTALPAVESITEITGFIKPTHSGGTGESITVVLRMSRERSRP